MKSTFLALTIGFAWMGSALAADPVLVVDDIHLQTSGTQPQYTISPSATLVIDASNYQFKVPPQFAGMPLNSLQLVMARDQMYGADWPTSAKRMVLSDKTLLPIPGSKPFTGFKSGQQGSLALGYFDKGQFSVIWAGMFKVQ